MHDWTLLKICFEWKSGEVQLEFLNQTSDVAVLSANEVCKLLIPRMNDWGPSVSVNNIAGPIPNGNGKSTLRIEMQSGDVIEIEAKAFTFP